MTQRFKLPDKTWVASRYTRLQSKLPPEWRKKMPSGREDWLRVGVVAGVLFLALAMVGSGFVVGMAVAFGRKMPDVTVLYSPPEEATRVYAANGEVIASLFRENRDFIPLHEIPKALRDAVIAIEDERFYEHRGVDPRGFVRALWHNLLAGGVVEGGSTVTMQLARNIFLTQRRELSRKVAEMILALEIERRLTKDEILERYLNQVYFGNGAYGVEMAARVFFGKRSADLTLAESTLLAGLVRAPAVYSPYQNLSAVQARQNLVLRRMADLGYITREQAAEAATAPINLSSEGAGGLVGIRAPYFVSYILPYLLQRYGEDVVYNGGLRVYTTVDPAMQDAAEQAIRRGIDQAQAENLSVTQGALVALDPRSGYIRAMVGGYDFAQSQFNRAWQARRQAGSAFKPFVYTAAIGKGMPPTKIIIDEEVTYEILGTVIEEDRIYTPRNYDERFRGPVTLRYALERSINVPAIKTAHEVGPQQVAEYARRMGIASPLNPTLSIALGSSDVTVLEMASAYGTIATLGVRAEPIAILKITDREGRVLEERFPRREIALSADVAYVMTDLLKGVVIRGTGGAAAIGRPAAGKTGTTDDYRNAWFIGFTPYLSAAVWVGNDDNTPMERVVGGFLPARIWGDFARQAVKGLAAEDWERPDGVTVATVCGDTGLLATSACSVPRQEVFIRGTEPTEFYTGGPTTPIVPGGPATPAAGGDGNVVVSLPLVITAPRQGQAVASPFMIEGGTDPNATVSLSIVAQGSFIKIQVTETRLPLTDDGRFAYLFRPPVQTSGVQYLITVTATGPDGGKASTTLVVKER